MLAHTAGRYLLMWRFSESGLLSLIYRDANKEVWDSFARHSRNTLRTMMYGPKIRMYEMTMKRTP